MIIKFFDLKSFSEGVGYVLLSIDLLKFDITSIYDLSYKVITMQNMFGMLVWLWFFYLGYGSSVVTIQQSRTIKARYHSKFADELS